ncbi:hypothetical protein BGZ60DRAFT_559606 [Tricladium varicosporioides]|nr:hypothetical protein BGZ60DRAFT_559606 [Hymenoscyphus varicosporioides]
MMNKDSSESRRLGRPRKETSSLIIENQRARVRRAQTAYRQRREAHISAVEQRCKNLEKIVEEMTTTFVGFSDRLVTSGTANENMIQDLKYTLAKFLHLGKSAAKEVSDEDEEMLEGGVIENGDERVSEENIRMAARFPDQDAFLSNTLSLDGEISNSAGGPAQMPSQWSDATTLNPYLNNSIWSPIQPATDASIVPYIVAGRDSFASRLYYETINLAARSLRGEAPWSFAESMFRFKMQYATRAQLSGVLGGVLNMLLLGTNRIQEGYVPQNVVDCEGEVKVAIVAQIVAGGETEQEYLSTWEVEKHLKEHWSLAIDSKAVKIQHNGCSSEKGLVSTINPGYSPAMFAPNFIPGFSQPLQAIFDIQTLIEGIKLMAVTIGEGPRWKCSDVDKVTKAFLKQNENLEEMGVLKRSCVNVKKSGVEESNKSGEVWGRFSLG